MEYRDLKKQYQVLKEQIDEVTKDVYSNASFIGGKHVKELEQCLAEYVGVKHCITCANGTDALQLALMSWNVGPGDAVLVPDFTYFSSGEAVSAVGATPIFVDVDERTYNINPVKLEEDIIRIKSDDRYNLKAVIAVDLFGLPADYSRIRPICDKYGLLLLEDGAQGFGGKLHGKKACSFGDISTTSFFPAKPLGCYGDGGAIFTNSDEWNELVRSYAVHGKGSSKYDNIRIGMNSRLDNLQAAILNVKFKAFIEYELEYINNAAKYYNELLENLDLLLPVVPEGYYSSWAQYTVQLPDFINRTMLQEQLKKDGIPTMIYYMKPMHCQDAYAGEESSIANCPVTKNICTKVLSLPLDPYKTYDDIKDISKSIKKCLSISL